MSRLIIKTNFGELKEGYATQINTNDVRPFTAKVGADIEFGKVLKTTTVRGVYESVFNAGTGDVTVASQIIGIALGTNVKLETQFPVAGTTSGQVDYKGGDQANNLTKGQVAMAYLGAAPGENVDVRIITVSTTAARVGVLTLETAPGADTTIALPGWVFTGLNDTAEVLAEVKLKY